MMETTIKYAPTGTGSSCAPDLDHTDSAALHAASSAPNTPEIALLEGADSETKALLEAIIAALKTVYDPEIPCDIYELGLIYRISIDDAHFVALDMTLTAPGCPVAGDMPGWVQDAVEAVPGVAGVTVTMVFDPPWDQARMSDEARYALDIW